jgi:hypothetical protein
MARTGLRMMPTFPLPPLKFRMAGFPRYGFKAGLSDEAFPADRFAIVLRTLCCHRYSLLCVRDDALISTSVRAGQAALPQGPSLRSGLCCPGPFSLNRPHPPHSRAHPDFTVSRLIPDALAVHIRICLGDPRLVLSVHRCSFTTMSSSETTGNFSAACTQCFTENTGLQLGIKVSAFPSSSHSDSGEGCVFEALLRFAHATTCCFASPPVGADQICIQPTRTFTSGLATVWSPAPPPDITTVPTGKLALAGLSPTRPSI